VSGGEEHKPLEALKGMDYLGIMLMKPTVWRASRPVSVRRGYPLMSLFDEMNRFFDDAWPAASSGGSPGEAFVPRIDLKETAQDFVITGEFPGMKVDNINIELNDNTVTLSGEKRHEYEQKEGERVYIERSFGSFSRTIPLNVEIDEDNATAEMKDGVLTITVPKSAKVVRGAKKLSIKAN
jgi:HSP20 family protein